MIKITDDMRELLSTALADGVPCLLGTVSAAGRPQIGPKGSVFAYDDETLAYWERTRRGALKNVGESRKVVIFYRNPGQVDRLPRGAAWRFHGTAEVHESGEIRDKVMAGTIQAELDRDPERKGAAVLVRLDSITDLGGNVLQER